MNKKILACIFASIIIIAGFSAYAFTQTRRSPEILSVAQVRGVLRGNWSLYRHVQHYNTTQAQGILLSLVPQVSDVDSGSFECLTNQGETLGMLVIQFSTNQSSTVVYKEYASYLGLMNHSTVESVGGSEYTYVENQTFGSGSGGVAHYSTFFMFIQSKNFLITNASMQSLVSDEITDLNS